MLSFPLLLAFANETIFLWLYEYDLHLIKATQMDPDQSTHNVNPTKCSTKNNGEKNVN